MTQPSSSILTSGAAIRDQVILPNRVALRICLRGIRTRLGRSVVTLLGVALGITFLMAVISGFHIKDVMRRDADAMLTLDRRLAVLRGETGSLPGKGFLLLGPLTEDLDRRFAAALAGQRDTRVLLAGADTGEPIRGCATATLPGDLDRVAAVLVAPAGLERLDALRPALADRRVFLLGAPPADRAQQLEAAGIRWKPLDVELRPEERQDALRREQEARQRMVWIVLVSLLITVIGISNAMLMSVTERIREIGTMKCLGALSSFVVKLFLLESSMIGLCGAVVGALGGVLFSVLTYSYTYGLFNILGAARYGELALYGGASVLTGMVLAVVAAIYPARVAAKMIPAAALMSNV